MTETTDREPSLAVAVLMSVALTPVVMFGLCVLAATVARLFG